MGDWVYFAISIGISFGLGMFYQSKRAADRERRHGRIQFVNGILMGSRDGGSSFSR